MTPATKPPGLPSADTGDDISPAALAPIPTATGSQLLRRSYKSNLGRGLVLAAVIHAAGLGLYWGVRAMEPAAEEQREIILTYENLAPPPSVADAPLPPDVPPPPAAPTPIAAGIPEAVPDDEAPPEQTIASQEELISTSPAGVGTNVGVIEGTGPPTAAPPPPPPPPPAPPPPPPEPEIFQVVEQMPELIGGLASIQPTYPEMERRAGIEGRVFLQFVVNEDGSVTEVTVTRGVSPGLDRAAVEAVQRARFRPGMQRGRAVKVRFSLPVNFRLN